MASIHQKGYRLPWPITEIKISSGETNDLIFLIDSVTKLKRTPDLAVTLTNVEVNNNALDLARLLKISNSKLARHPTVIVLPPLKLAV